MCQFQNCPRCGEKSYERLKTHGYCINCNYSPELESHAFEDDRPIPAWAEEAVKKMDEEGAASKKKKKSESKLENKVEAA